MTSIEVMDWDNAYREQGEFEGPPPWNIGEPQPELAALIAAGKFRSDVLDAGCGFAELSLALAAQGYTVVGIDLTPTAVAAATKAAAERGLTHGQLRPGRHHLVHRLSTAGSPRWSTARCFTRCRSRAATAICARCTARRPRAPATSCWCSPRAPSPPRWKPKPNEVDEDELRAAVSKYWEIDEIRPAYIHANIPHAAGRAVRVSAARPRRKGPDEAARLPADGAQGLRLGGPSASHSGRRGDQRLGERLQVIGGGVDVRRDPQHRPRSAPAAPAAPRRRWSGSAARRAAKPAPPAGRRRRPGPGW